ncbi:hypothetical protein CEY00_Acc10900 [Actinidia chinensis var. chinensis]|uniref:Protein LNK3 n=1 Tax=Actinidia chinensis var. chinensis TaxID=1590841 RepID=A0A2R6R140_ACTCC|nr:hypothetical protein CEY00_Acc10900 [Actinidia chinensis var. chinensis]
MEWYFGSGVDDLVVPRDQEPLDRLPSPNSWSLWGVSATECFKSTNKYSIPKKSSISEETNYHGEEGLYEEVDMDLLAHSNSNMYLQEDSLQQATSPWESPDYQLSDIAGTNKTDEFFMSSLLEEDPSDTDNVHGSFNFFPELEYGLLPADNLLTDMILESDYDPSHLFGMARSKYLKTHAFSPSMDWGHGEGSALHVPSNLRQNDNTPLKALVAKFAASPELDIMNGHVNEESSLEVSVLHELERVMAQFSEKTRICFRDALYRLAQNSEQHIVDRSQNGDLIPDKLPQLTVRNETLRLENAKTVESKTNAIDRAVANLLFSKTNSEDGAQDFPAEANITAGQYNYSLRQPQLPHYSHYKCLAGDAEVPIIA